MEVGGFRDILDRGSFALGAGATIAQCARHVDRFLQYDSPILFLPPRPMRGLTRALGIIALTSTVWNATEAVRQIKEGNKAEGSLALLGAMSTCMDLAATLFLPESACLRGVLFGASIVINMGSLSILHPEDGGYRALLQLAMLAAFNVKVLKPTLGGGGGGGGRKLALIPIPTNRFPSSRW